MKKIIIDTLPEDYNDRLKEKIDLINPQRVKGIKKREPCSQFAVSVYASAAVAQLAGEYLGKKSTDLIFDKTETGKPFFKDVNDLYFNISHSFLSYAVAISDSPIGIDIEVIREVNLKIAERMFTENEKEYVGNDTVRFFEIWTKKEAYSKFTGKGLGEKFSSFDVLLPPLADNFTFEIKDGAAVAVYSVS